jgi:hypothetical protein
MSIIPNLEKALRKYINVIQMNTEKDIIKCKQLYKEVEDAYVELHNILIDFDIEYIDIYQNGYKIDKDNKLQMNDSLIDFANKLAALYQKIENEYKIKIPDIIKIISIDSTIVKGAINHSKKNDSEIILKPSIKCEPCNKNYICDYGNCNNIEEEYNKCMEDNQFRPLKKYSSSISSSIISSSIICCSIIIVIGFIIIMVVMKKK